MESRFINWHQLAYGCLPILSLCSQVAPAHAQEQSTSAVTITASELFAFADRARDAGDFVAAETAYRALTNDPELELRVEARFRLGMMFADQMQKYREAAIEFRRILDEKPKATRVRLELARMQAMLGNLGSAEREFRAAQAGGLPPDVEQIVRFYANALRGRKAFGGTIEAAIAPDSNINRATKSDTLGTIIGDFALDQNAKAQSGVGLTLRGQLYARASLSAKSNLLVQLSGSADLYRASQFDDFILGLQVGPEFVSGRDKIALSVGPALRWYGTDPYSRTISGNANWQHPLGKRSQLRVDIGAARLKNKRNDLQDATTISLSAGLDRAFSARFGGGLQIYGNRELARDPGYSTTSGGLNAYLFREFGKITAVLAGGYNHLEGDERLFLYPARRNEDRFNVSLSATFRALRIGSFAPLAKLRYERNKSAIEIYDIKRFAGEIGITSAF